MVVRGDGVDHLGRHAVAPGKLGPQHGVGAFHVVIHGLAQVVQQPGGLRDIHVRAQLRGQHARQVRHFHGVLELVLPVGGAELESAEHLHDLWVQPGHASIVGGLLAGIRDDAFHFLLLLLEDLFDVRRVDAAILHQLGQRAAGNLTPHRVEARNGHGFGRIVHDHVHAGSLLEGVDIAAVAANDAPLHFLGWDGHHRGGHL